MDNFDPSDIDQEAERRALLNLSGQGSAIVDAPEYQDQIPSKTESFLRGGTQGATFRWGDELSAGLGALAPTITDEELGRSYSDRYAHIRDDIRKHNKDAQIANPKSYMGGQITGGVTTAAATPFITSSTPAIAASLAGYGALTGAGDAQGEEPSIEDKATIRQLKEEGSVVGEQYPTELESKLSGVYEGAKDAIIAPYEMAKATGKKLGAGDIGEAFSSGTLMAASILPFALKGKPINEFTAERAFEDINRAETTGLKALEQNNLNQLNNINEKLNNTIKDAEKSLDLYTQAANNRKITPEELTDMENNLVSIINRSLDVKTQLLSRRLFQTRESVLGARQIAKEMRPKNNIVNLDVERAQRTPEVTPAELKALQVTDESGQVHNINTFFPEEMQIKSKDINQQLKKSLAFDSNRKIIPPEVFQAKLNALRNLQKKSRVGKITINPSDWFK